MNGDFVFTADRLEPSDTPGVFFYTGFISPLPIPATRTFGGLAEAVKP